MTDTAFRSLHLVEPILKALTTAGYSEATPIQKQAIPLILSGKDLLACAQTGTGKTAAFALPVLQNIYGQKRKPKKKEVKTLVLTPTRELALQIQDSFRRYGAHLGLRSTVVFGGVGAQPQITALASGCDILVATPGRLLDLLQGGHLRLDLVSTLILDEADRMLDMGFIRDVKKILAQVPEKRQTLLFSATMPPTVERLAANVLHAPEKIVIAPQSTTAELIDDKVLFVERSNKRALLLEVLEKKEVTRAIVFTRTKHRANRVAKQLNADNIRAEAIHGNKAQGARQRALQGFTAGKVRVLVATDVLARGIDVAEISHVINYELPNEPESYVHRIGRTARGGAAGIALSFCDSDEAEFLDGIEKTLRRKVSVFTEHSHHEQSLADAHQSGSRPRGKSAGAHRKRSSGPAQVRRRRSSRRGPRVQQ